MFRNLLAMTNSAGSAMALVGAVLLVALLGVLAWRMMARRGRKDGFDVIKCKVKSSSGAPMTCPQPNLSSKGYGCLGWDRQKCCKDNMWDCKAMDKSYVNYSWALPKLYTNGPDGTPYNLTWVANNGYIGDRRTGTEAKWITLPSGVNNELSYIVVPKGYKVTVAENERGEGYTHEFGEGSYDLKQVNWSDGTDINDDIGSVKIERV